jgi:enoyl-[acyl-carrier protein] reductase/trans-2-enoyl-CoA reductase (NAD+)
MKEKNLHEGCIEQMYRLFRDKLYSSSTEVDASGLIRIDDLEMRKDVQDAVDVIWNKVNSENVHELSDIDGYRNDFFRLFGFGYDEIDYDADVDIEVNIPSLKD